MDQLIFASLSHTHYWYEMGMLKVPAFESEVVTRVFTLRLFVARTRLKYCICRFAVLLDHVTVTFTAI